jgi:hypothetical protein
MMVAAVQLLHRLTMNVVDGRAFGDLMGRCAAHYDSRSAIKKCLLLEFVDEHCRDTCQSVWSGETV